MRRAVVVVLSLFFIAVSAGATQLPYAKRQALKKLGTQWLALAPATVQKGDDLTKAQFAFDQLCLHYARKKVTVNSSLAGRAKKGTQDTCDDLSERLRHIYYGMGISAGKITDVLADKNSYNKLDVNRNHIAIGVVVNGQVFMFDPWEHAVNNTKAPKTFQFPKSSKWRAMKLDDWEKEMISQGYVRFSIDEGLTYHNTAATAVAPLTNKARPTFAGKWDTSWGVLTITVNGSQAEGHYPHDSGKINGTISADGLKLIGTWGESPTYSGPNDGGDVIFTLAPNNKSITGEWWYGSKPDDPSTKGTGSWNGARIY